MAEPVGGRDRWKCDRCNAILILDEGSSGDLLAYCQVCREIVGAYDHDAGRVVYDRDPELRPLPPSVHPLLQWAIEHPETQT